MAVLTNKLHIKKGSTVYECNCYTTSSDATPAVSGGSYWTIRNNNTVCYLGLWPKSASTTSSYSTPLVVKKNGVEYYVQTQVINTFTVTITQSANQTIKVTCNGNTYTETFTALAGSAFTVTVTPATGYTAGAPSVSSGNVTSNITITASPASKAKYTVTINQSSNQTITVTANGTNYTSTFTADYGTTWTAKIAASTGYNAGTLSATSGTVTGNVTISATAASKKMYSVTITKPTNGAITAKVGSTTYTATTTFSVAHGTSVTFTCTPNSGYTFSSFTVS